jgi:outer membrane receptor protein involved in Fe transport
MVVLLRNCWVLIFFCSAGFALAATGAWQGRSVVELLQSMAEQGHRIIYSSDVVTDDLLIFDEPDLDDPVSGLASVLEAHELDLSEGPGGTWLIRERPEPNIADATEPERFEASLPEIIVTSSLHRLEYSQSGTQTYLDRELSTRIPAAAEEAVRITTRLPGTASGGISSRSHVRGGEANEVLFLLDGLRLYEPFHLKDFQSVATIINSNAIDGIDFFSGAYPAKYGDRMSGVMNISLRTSQEDAETELALSFFNTSALSIGKFGGNEQGDWLFAARRGNLDLIADVIDPEFGSPDYQDYLLHAGWEFHRRAKLSVNILASRDKLTLNDLDRGESANARYENEVLWLKWDADWNDVLRSTTILSRSSIVNRRAGTLDLPDIVNGSILDSREFDSFGLRQDWVFAPRRNWMLSFGIDGKHQDARYDFASTKIVAEPFDAILDNRPLDIRNIIAEPEGARYGAYVEYRWQPHPSLTVDAGIRWDIQSYTTAADDEQSSPRLAVLYKPNPQTEIRVGWGQFSQAQEINELQASDGIDEFFPAQRAEHVVANLQRRFGKDLSMEVSYYRKSFRAVRPRYENAFNVLTLLPEIQFDRYRIDPESAEAHGAELRVAKGDGGQSLFWWLGYAWSEVRDRTTDNEIPRSWDQTHAVKAGVSWRWGSWDLSAAGEVHTGWPKTELIAQEVPNPDGTHSLVLTATPANSRRYSAFHTLDMRVSRDFALRRGELTAFLEVSNLYDRDNPCCTEYSIGTSDTGPVLIAREARWLPLIPSLGVVWRF